MTMSKFKRRFKSKADCAIEELYVPGEVILGVKVSIYVSIGKNMYIFNICI